MPFLLLCNIEYHSDFIGGKKVILYDYRKTRSGIHRYNDIIVFDGYRLCYNFFERKIIDVCRLLEYRRRGLASSIKVGIGIWLAIYVYRIDR